MSRWGWCAGALSWGLVFGCQLEFARVAESSEESELTDDRALFGGTSGERGGDEASRGDYNDGGALRGPSAPTNEVVAVAVAGQPSGSSPEAAESETSATAAVDGVEPRAACDNGAKDGNETDRDCGGDCGPCRDGLACRVGADCESRLCVSGRCAEPRCDDQQHNGNETDVDCGGSCAPCANGSRCAHETDCVSGYCIEGICRDVECTDEERNGSETDVDCGGPDCAACGEGLRCEQPEDCLSLVCARTATASGLRCQPPRCDDGVRNAREGDVDCGGDCDACDEGFGCVEDEDCHSRSCIEEVCAAPTCEDERRNGDESDVDCGGTTCEPCPVDLRCEVDSDCLSQQCVEGVCERGSFGDPCRTHGDCLSGACEANRCLPGLPADGCREANDCYSARCEQTCIAGDLTIQSNSAISSGDTDGTIQIGLRIQAGPTTYEWAELAFLYFFDPDGAEQLRRVDFDHSHDHEPLAHCADVGASQWIYVYRTEYAGPVAGEVQLLEQVANDPWSGFDDTNDYSFSPTWDISSRIVVCRRHAGRWGLLQGTPPEEIPDACAYAGGCDGTRRCRVLE